jgi:hypothetical protein
LERCGRRGNGRGRNNGSPDSVNGNVDCDLNAGRLVPERCALNTLRGVGSLRPCRWCKAYFLKDTDAGFSPRQRNRTLLGDEFVMPLRSVAVIGNGHPRNGVCARSETGQCHFHRLLVARVHCRFATGH